MANRETQEILNAIFDTTNNGLRVSNATSPAVFIPPGVAVKPNDPATGVFAPGANALVATSFIIEKTQLFNRICIKVGTQNGNIDVALADDDGAGGMANTRLVSTGSIACPAPGHAAITIADTILTPGWWWAVFATDSATATIDFTAIGHGSALRSQRCDKAAAFPIPAAIGAAGAPTSAPFLIYPGYV